MSGPPASSTTTTSSQAQHERLRIERVEFGGAGLGVREDEADALAPQMGRFTRVPLALPGELTEATAPVDGFAEIQRVLEPSPDRVAPGCPYFGTCGGCHLQMGSYAAQLRIKREVLVRALTEAGVTQSPAPIVHAAEPWGYRSRIRLRVAPAGQQGGKLALGYTRRGDGTAFQPIDACPIAAPVLLRAAHALLHTAELSADWRTWLEAAREVELFTTANETQIGVTLLCPAPFKKDGHSAASMFDRGAAALSARLPELTGAGALHAVWSPLRQGKALASWGSPGLTYEVMYDDAVERYWVPRGSFFQVNRFLLPELTTLVCAGRTGELAWDLYAGVGLLSRLLTRRWREVVAVEANPGSAASLQDALRRIGRPHRVEVKTTLAFLREAVLQRERPQLVVLDPPRAGAGAEVCSLLLRLRPEEIVYVSCDPLTLARDLALLQTGYSLEALNLFDLFPQTYHQEAVVFLTRRP